MYWCGMRKNQTPKDGMWWLWPAVWAMISIFWLGYFMLFSVDWLSLGLGGLTGMMFAYYAVEISGNKFDVLPPGDRSSD